MIISLMVLQTASSPLKHIEKDEKCMYNNMTYPAGTHFRPDPCTYCHCPKRGGRAQCAIEDCFWDPSCVRYHRDSNECCGQCVQHGCRHSDGKIYNPETVVSETSCEQCVCPPGGGMTICTAIRCPRATCVDPIRDPGDCCYRCPNGMYPQTYP